MKKLLLVFLLTALPLFATNATVTGTVTDANGQAIANGTITAQFNPNGNSPPFLSGGVAFTQTVTGTLNASGAFSITVTTNTSINPAGTLWLFTVCTPFTTKNTCGSVLTSISGNVSLSTQLSASMAAVSANAAVLPQAYVNGEITNPVAGSMYYDWLNGNPKFYNGSSWIPLTQSGGIGQTQFFGTTDAVNPKPLIVLRQGQTSNQENIAVLNTAGQSLADCGAGCYVATTISGPYITAGNLFLTGQTNTTINTAGVTTHSGGPYVSPPAIVGMQIISTDVATTTAVSINDTTGDLVSVLNVVNPGTLEGAFTISDTGRIGWGKGSYITGCTESGVTATCTTNVAHNLVNGQKVLIQGLQPTRYNGYFTATVTAPTTFTYTTAAGSTPTADYNGTLADSILSRTGVGVLGIDGALTTTNGFSSANGFALVSGNTAAHCGLAQSGDTTTVRGCTAGSTVYLQTNDGNATMNVHARAYGSEPLARASLPDCDAGHEGWMQAVNNATSNVWGDTVVNGGGFHVLAYCDGTNWTVAAK